MPPQTPSSKRSLLALSMFKILPPLPTALHSQRDSTFSTSAFQRRRRDFLRLVLGLGRPLSEEASASASPPSRDGFPDVFRLLASAMRRSRLRSIRA